MKPTNPTKPLLILAILIWTAQSMAGHVSLLGSTELYKDVFNIKDIDRIHLGRCGVNSDNTPVHKVKIKVTDNDIYLDSIVATFGNGQKQAFSVRKNFSQGSQSRWIDLKGNLRCIESLQLVGNTTTSNLIDIFLGPTATVQVWGLRQTPPINKIKKITQQKVKYGKKKQFKFHQKFIRSCNSGKGKFKNLRIVARNGRLKVRKFRVTFGNGQSQTLHFRKGFFYRNQVSNWKDLFGNRRCIKKISYKALTPNGARLVLQGR